MLSLPTQRSDDCKIWVTAVHCMLCWWHWMKWTCSLLGLGLVYSWISVTRCDRFFIKLLPTVLVIINLVQEHNNLRAIASMSLAISGDRSKHGMEDLPISQFVSTLMDVLSPHPGMILHTCLLVTKLAHMFLATFCSQLKILNLSSRMNDGAHVPPQHCKNLTNDAYKVDCWRFRTRVSGEQSNIFWKMHTFTMTDLLKIHTYCRTYLAVLRLHALSMSSTGHKAYWNILAWCMNRGFAENQQRVIDTWDYPLLIIPQL